MRATTTLTLAGLLVLTGTAAADCPTNLRELAPTGFLASAVRAIGAAAPAEERPGFTAQVAAAGGMRAETDDVHSTAALSGEVTAQRGGLAGCASADLLDLRETSAHVTASGQVPLLFTGLNVGFTLDRDVRLPLAARAEFLRAPISRIASQFSMAFIDMDLADGNNRLRLMVVPFTVEQGLATQDETMTLDRKTTRLETSMFRFVASDPTGTGDIAFFTFDADWNEARNGMLASESGAIGFVRISPLSIARRSAAWSWELDGGLLDLAGPVDCESVRCLRGFYVGAITRTWDELSVETRAERSAFIASSNEPALEDRVSATVAFQRASRRAAAAVFGARTEMWVDGEAARSAGVRLTFTQQLARGFAAIIDGELARLPALPMATSGGDAARLFVSLAWEKKTQR